MSKRKTSKRRPLGGVLAAIGTILVILAVVRLDSFESQFVRGFGGRDDQSTNMLVLGIPSLLAGIWMLLSSSRPR